MSTHAVKMANLVYNLFDLAYVPLCYCILGLVGGRAML